MPIEQLLDINKCVQMYTTFSGITEMALDDLKLLIKLQTKS